VADFVPNPVLKVLFLLCFAALLLGALGIAGLAYTASPIEERGATSLFVVERGDGVHAISARLQRDGYIRSSFAFLVISRLRGSDSELKAGTYRIGPSMGAGEILDTFVSGNLALFRVTVPEGYTIRQTAALLEEEGVATAADFEKICGNPEIIRGLGIPANSLEGYLFPDTYYFPAAFGAEGAARRMVRAFRDRIAAIPEASSLTEKELHARVIIASIVEREYRQTDEAPLMASVFFNRLRIGMALQSCATVVYVITEKLGKPHPDTVYSRDLAIDDEYNTYLRKGLPPGPISNPGMTALNSVFAPAPSKYLYFRLVDVNSGKHHFSETLEEHIEAGALSVKRVGG
jgi:UPF0755 protein